MRTAVLLCALALGACTVLRPTEEFSEAALYANDQAYVSLRYKQETAAVDLRDELIAKGYVCEPEAAGGYTCSQAAPAPGAPGCQDVGEVRIVGGYEVRAARSRRCAGVISPP